MAKKESDTVKEKAAQVRELETKLQEARDALEKERLELLTMVGAEARFDKFVSKTTREVLRLREAVNPLARERDALTDVVRTYVTAKPSGWLIGMTVEENHLVWISPDGDLKVVLVDSPTYELTVDDLVALVGFKNATAFLKVNYTALLDAAATGALINERGETVTVESIIDRRTRKPRAKRVDIEVMDPRDAPAVVQVINPELAAARLEALESLGLSAATITALRENCVQTAYQLRHLSGEEISALRGIGPKRAVEIMTAIVKHTP